ncbi:Nrap protein [Parelaphostrongylus tenuis]|uniref:Nucleolar protein 6 n=1 Tax=Parelaphostrongylus tenuis TaxID=148309 RepID=A0AAD5R4L7_PARTN|nr:Nrap protein [Parelaphostrongylus tenuis]
MPRFDGIFLACVMVHLMDKNVVIEQQDLLTILRNFFLAIVNWDTSSPMGFHADDLDNEVIAAYLSTFPVVFLDSTGYFNIASGISMESLLLVKADASHSLSVLGDCLTFDTLFLERHHLYSMFDHYFRLLRSLCKISDLLPDTVDENDRITKFAKMLIARIHECMDERFDNVYIERVRHGKSHPASFLIGFRVRKEWANPITVGPLATDPKAGEFRQLWKEKTQLRKFADARICECMVWADTTSMTVPYSILQFIIRQELGSQLNCELGFVVSHFNMPVECLSWRSVLPADFLSRRDINVTITSALAGLSAILRSAKGLPLMVTNIQAVSSYIRDTEPCASDVLCRTEQGTIENGSRMPAQRAIPPYVAAVTVHIKLEYSGKWGDTIDGVLHLSAAFYIEIAKFLREKHNLIAIPTKDQLFVIKDGVPFKLVLVLDKVLKILERRVAEMKSNSATQMELSLEEQRLAKWKKHYIYEARLQASLHSCSTKYVAYGETVQLLKRWLSGQYMTGAIHDLALEMIVVSVFEDIVRPPPQTSIAAFRRVLELICKHNWTARPLLVNFGNSWDEKEIAKLEENFVKMRPILPPMVIVTNEDPTGAKWTRDGPTPLLLKRLVGLSESMVKLLDRNYEDTKIIDIKFAFLNVDMSIYDAVIEIYPKVVVRSCVSDAVNSQRNVEALPVLNFDPIDDFICALNAHYQHVALFFWNKYGGDRIGIKWKPHEMDVPAKISRCSIHIKILLEHVLLLIKTKYWKEYEYWVEELLKKFVAVVTRRTPMADIDALVGELSEAHVDSTALGEHPRFSQYKNAGKAAEQQAQRRQEALERQRNSRFDHFNHTRRLAENEMSDKEDEQSEIIKAEQHGKHGDAEHHDEGKKCRKSRYADVLMLSEWLVDIPDKLSAEWMMVPSPVGKRVLVVAAKGTTTVYNKGGRVVTQFRSCLPGGSVKSTKVYTILDCILDSKKTCYCLDVLAWNGMDMSANPFDFRQFMLSTKLMELPELPFLSLPCCKCQPELMEEMMRNGFDFELDGLLYYYTGVVYEAGQSPLVGWLKPWMLPEILNVAVPEKFLNENTLQQSTQQFIDAFNIAHNHTSKIRPTMEVE